MNHTHAPVHNRHGHAQPREGYSLRKHPEFVVLDIGHDVGALIVHTDAHMHGMEVEISHSGDDRQRSHKEVLERRTGEDPAFTAVFDGLPVGTYTLWLNGRARARGVRVAGGAISQLDWRVTARTEGIG
jgi:hypothetical protein